MKCSICNKEIIGDSHNAQPINSGSCCSECNTKTVVPLRIYLSGIHFDKALVLKIDNTLQLLKPKGKTFELDELQNQVQGYIEIYPIHVPNHIVIVNEEGILHKMAFNDLAHQVFGISAVGPVVICPESLFE